MRKDNLIRLVIFGIVFMLFGCSEDLYEEKKSSTWTKSFTWKFEDLFQNQKFNRAIREIEQIKAKKEFAVNKTVMENQYGFTISDRPVNVIENNTITSYTIYVIRDTNPINVIENLIIQVNQHNEINAF